MKVLLAYLAGLATAVAVPAALVHAGIFDIGAAAGPLPLEQTVAPWARDRAVARRAPKGPNPHPGESPAALERYRAACLSCHGAPGLEPAVFARGLQPMAPDLASSAVQARPDGELFWITRHGLRATGMPSLVDGGDEDAWRLVAFLRRLPRLSDAEKAALAAEGRR